MGIYDIMRKAYKEVFIAFLILQLRYFYTLKRGVCLQGYKVQHPARAKSMIGHINLN